ncbi:hypothetical protein [Stenotrophomonas maltophilia]|uniref:hypothetical protein n=1 Tax=Stenotrophomonas maltophilia TaxID=40324 RepID=UPI0005B70D9A|nr:hypothetical protein [Stenotrophomonas maltophilia]KIS38452.1 hypothetical protein WJ66_00454 [Stenotrophomonas maltophilia WJ66]MCF3460814.1 hypothetical protein [Stenotrophomonas maltophilia]MCF3517725.1 hypothetical protein [Stenotrophomonas maltophilia]
MIGEVQAAVQALTVGISALRAVQGADKALNEAEWKLKLAEAMTALADAKMALTDVAGVTQGLQDEVRRLQDALTTKGEVVRRGDAYYRKGPKGQAIGDPYCMRCFEKDSRLMSLRKAIHGEMNSACPACNAKFDRRRTVFIAVTGAEDW